MTSANHENLTLDNLACYLSNPFICTTPDCFHLKGLDLWSWREANTQELKLGTFSLQYNDGGHHSHANLNLDKRWDPFLLELSLYSLTSVFHLAKSTDNTRKFMAIIRLFCVCICSFPCNMPVTILLAKWIQLEISLPVFLSINLQYSSTGKEGDNVSTNPVTGFMSACWTWGAFHTLYIRVQNTQNTHSSIWNGTKESQRKELDLGNN